MKQKSCEPSLRQRVGLLIVIFVEAAETTGCLLYLGGVRPWPFVVIGSLVGGAAVVRFAVTVGGL